jgi:hypothetical protein
MRSPSSGMAEERTARTLSLITLIRLPPRAVVLRANPPQTSETSWTPLSKPFRYRRCRRFQRTEGAHSIQVSIPCPLVVDRAKMLPRLAISCVMITRVLAPELRSHKGADREVSRSSCAISVLRV